MESQMWGFVKSGSSPKERKLWQHATAPKKDSEIYNSTQEKTEEDISMSK